jgi:hypothetical protein
MTHPEQARQDLTEILSDGRLELSDAQARMAERGHPAGRIDRARRALEIETVREGPPGTRQRFFWQLPGTCPTCLRPYGPDAGHEATAWGMNRAGSSDYWSDAPAPIEPPSNPPEARPAPPPLPDYGPPRCNVCGRASASSPGQQCPYQTMSGVRCVGTVG